MFGPNGPTANAFHNRLLIGLDISPFEDGRPDQRRQPRYIEDITKWKIIGMSIGQDVGGGELRNDWDTVRDKGKINKISLSLDLIVSLAAGV